MGNCLSQSSTSGGVKPGGKLPKRASQQMQMRDRRKSRLSQINMAAVLEEYKSADPNKYVTKTLLFNGAFKSSTKGRFEEVSGQSIRVGLQQFKENPQQYLAMMYPTEMLTQKWPAEECEYKVLHRAGTTGFEPSGVGKGGAVTLLVHNYQPLPSFTRDALPPRCRDRYTDTILSHQRGRKLRYKMPGRGMGLMDQPNLKIIGEVDPSDIDQGDIGDCWLLSGIASLAEYDGAVRRLFRKTKMFDNMPFESTARPTQYTVTLWDTKTWKEVDVVIDERLPMGHQPNQKKLLGAKASDDGELWVAYLEKAMAAHCGGWDKLDGGQTTHAWALLTGCKKQYLMHRRTENKKQVYKCFARFEPGIKRWPGYSRAPCDVKTPLCEVAWPKLADKGGDRGSLGVDEVFDRMCDWDNSNYLMAASSKGFGGNTVTDGRGVEDLHAYSIIDCRKNAAGTGIDLIQIRNPWGKGTIENAGIFGEGGSGWTKYPRIKRELKPIFGEDGIFWLTKDEFFRSCETIYLSASNMTQFLKPKSKGRR